MTELTDTERESDERVRRHLYGFTGGLGLSDLNTLLAAHERAAVAAALAPIEALAAEWEAEGSLPIDAQFAAQILRAALAGGGDQ